MKKLNRGFTLVELIVVIAVLALLAVGAVIAFQGIQTNARRSILSADTNSLVTALNAANATAAARGGALITGRAMGAGNIPAAATRMVFTVPAGGGLGDETFVVDFDTLNHATRALSATVYTPNTAAGIPGTYSVDSARIAQWGGAQADTVIP